MTSKPRGLYRSHGADAVGASVFVTYGAHGFAVAAARYVDDAFAPPIDTLPWKDEYDRDTAGLGKT